jgi:hypothetical protein
MQKLSATQFAKAAATSASLTEQNQAMEQVNVDVVDMVNQIAAFESPNVPEMAAIVPKTVLDVKFIVAQAMARLRLILVTTKVDFDRDEEIKRLEAALVDAMSEIEELEDEAERCW